jgi:hypothetical protein
MWYSATDIMALLECSQSKAYGIAKALADEVAKMKIPGTNRHYSRPPAGKIQSHYFCEKFMLDRTECDEIAKRAKVKSTQKGKAASA